MILDALQKVNSSLNNTSKSLMNEDLKSILNIHHFGLDKALQIANNGNKFSNPITYLKFKVIDALKDLELSKKILGSYFKEQLTKIEEAIENPIVRQQILEENLFKVKNNDKHIKVDSFVEVAILHEIGSQEGKDEVLTAHRTINSNLGIKRKVLNPFSGVVVDLEMQIDQMHTMHGNTVLTMDKKYHDVNLYENIGIGKFYLDKTLQKMVYINEDDLERICLLAKFKLNGDFTINNLEHYPINENIIEKTAKTAIKFRKLLIYHSGQ